MQPRIEIHFTREERKIFKAGVGYTMPENEFWLNHCRSGITLALQVLNLPKGSRVGMMVYNCHTVLNSIWQAGCEVVFVDVTSRLQIDEDDLLAKSEGMQALVVTHLFGIANDIKRLKKKFPHLIIIEDCAHYFDKPIDGDFGVYSVGQGKFPSIGDGGILVVNNDKYLQQIQSAYKQLPAYTTKQERKLYLKLLIKALLYQPLIYQLISRFKKHRHTQVSPSKEPIRKMSNGIANGLISKRVNYFRKVETRKQIAQNLVHKYDISSYVIGENAFMLVVFLKSIGAFQEKLRIDGIESATHFSNCIKWAGEYGYRQGVCPNAERLVNGLLMIPVYEY